MSEERRTIVESVGDLFGLDIKRKKEVKELPSFVPKQNEDGAMVIAPSGVYGQYMDLEGKVKSDSELVSRYRELSLQPEMDFAVGDIINECVVIDDINPPVHVNMDEVDFSDKIKKTIEEEFENVISLLNFNNKGYDIFRQWYVDGRLYYHAIIEDGKEKDGIKELRNIDPRKIRKVVELKSNNRKQNQTAMQGSNGVLNAIISETDEYYIFNRVGFVSTSTASTSAEAQGMKINPDAIVHTTSGIMDSDNSLILSHLHKAIKPFNQLRMLEDATIIYHLSRAPERRLFYIDVGNLPTSKAEQYVSSIMSKYKNKMVYDAVTGEVRDDKRHMSMLEDYWIPRREGGKGTEITTLGGGQNLTDNIESVEYFKKKLYKALNVPYSRLESDSAFSFGRATEVSRDEVRFARFITRLRSRFNDIFDKVLEKQLLLKNIVSQEDWDKIKKDIKYLYSTDSFFSELKDLEIVRERFGLLRDIDDYTTNATARDQGKPPEAYISVEWVRKNILQQDDNDIKDIKKNIKDEMGDIEADAADEPDNGDGGDSGFYGR